MPLPLSVMEISAVVDAYSSPIDRELLDTCVLAIDAKFLDSVKPKKQTKEDVGKAWGSFVQMVNGE